MTDHEPDTAIVSGAGSGLGKAISTRLAKAGYMIAAIDVDGGALERLRDETERSKIVTFTADATDATVLRQIADELENRKARPRILVNNVGIAVLSRIMDYRQEDWEKVIATNLTGCFLASQIFGALLLKSHSGRIVNIASVTGVTGFVRRGAYAASKAGIISLTRTMAMELGAHGVTVNAVCPGPVDTAASRRVHDDRSRQAWTKATPIGRFVTETEVAATVEFLCSHEAAGITGQAILVDGGLSIGVALEQADREA